jgi:hypothetical protein
MNRAISLILLAIPVSGCGAADPAPNVEPSLSRPADVAANGALAGSRVTARRSGRLDPNGTDVTLAVTGARVHVRAGDRTVALEEIALDLADLDLPPSASLPEGLKLRQQRLVAPGRIHGDTLRRTDDALDLRVDGKLAYHASMVLSDGSLYALGPTDMEDANVEVHLARDGGAAKVVLEAPPGGTCGSVGDLFTLSDCSLFVESAGPIANVQ